MVNLLLRIFKSSQFKDLFIRFLAVLCVALLLPFVYIFLQDRSFNENVKKKNFDLHAAETMEPGKRMIDNLILDFETKTIEFTNSRAVLNAVNKTQITKEFSDLLILKNELNMYADSLCCVDRISLLFKEEGLTKSITQGSMNRTPLSADQWNGLVASMKANGNWQIHDGNLPGEQTAEQGQKRISLIRPIPAIGSEPQGLIIVSLDPRALFTNTIRPRSGEELWVLSPNGRGAFETNTGSYINTDQFAKLKQQLSASPDFTTTSFNNRDYFGELKRSERTAWSYFYLIPSSHIDVYSHNQVLLGIIVVFVLAMAGYIGLELRKVYQPVKKLISLFNKNKDMIAFPNTNNNEFAYLVSAVTSILDKEIAMEGQIQANLSIIRQKILKDMLNQASGDHRKRVELLGKHGIFVTPYGFIVSVIRINDYIEFKMKYTSSDQELLRFFISKFTEEVSVKRLHVYTVDMNDRDIILIFNVTEPLEHEHVRNLVLNAMEETYEHLKNYLPLQISIGMGDLAEDLSVINKSYEQAKRALATFVTQNKEHIKPSWLIQEESDPNIYMNNLREKTQRDIANAFFSNEMAKVSDILNLLKKYIIDTKEYPIVLVRHTYLEIILTILGKLNESSRRPNDSVDINNIYDRMNNIETVDRIVQYAETLLRKWADQLEYDEKTEELTIVQKMVEYVNINFNKEISLNGIAYQLGFDPSHVSRLFKQEVGTNFMEYLLTLRINHAKHLLTNGKMTVNEISERVGYNNVHSFIRAFKKFEGTTPGQFRDSNHKRFLDSQEVY
ncbi:helix-turn-helix domain-containing protein [Paenibacillus arenilitoris]|uniref:Helix-turn-helix transcriptional regulator n=1 Tax=Paenibacillus arenilitoris TaxID=2772299 RepID=A0A927CVV1_9BACL|nr:helix-turn-helix domain-containing protein [Paenibacillus arenilitoris]MBD2872771.1 helix-turn-helix transcriptional regulator [Paenibacillus arenilitoris]